jgi:hypothetical protein
MLSAGATAVTLDGDTFAPQFPAGVRPHRHTTERALRNASAARNCVDAEFLDADTFSRLAVELAFGVSPLSLIGVHELSRTAATCVSRW